MTATIWIAKADGTLQCDEGKEISLDEMAKELESYGPKVLEKKKVNDCKLHSAVCGAPTGQVNAYLISIADWLDFQSGIVGTMGFFELECDVDMPNAAPTLSSVLGKPVLVRELIGRVVRCYKEGDPITKDYRPNRVNIVHDKNSVIINIWYG